MSAGLKRSQLIDQMSKTTQEGATATDASFFIAASDATDVEKSIAQETCTGANDDVIINAAIQALTLGGGTIAFSSGTFSISSPILLDDNYICLRGQGFETVLKAATNLNDSIIETDKTVARYGFTIRDMTLDGNSANQSTSGVCIDMTAMNQSLIDNVKVYQAKTDGIYCDGTTYDTKVNTVTHCVVSAGAGDGIHLKQAWAWLITDNPYIGNNTVNGINLETGGELAVKGNVIDQNAGRGIYTYGTTRFSIQNNPYIGDNGKCGIEIAHASSADILISGNIILENGSVNQANHANGIDIVDGDRIFITGNRITDNSSGDQDYGIKLASDASTVWIVNNELTGNAVAAISDDGATGLVIRNNSGWVTEAKGTSKIDSGATTVNVTHGLSATPTVINVTFAEAGTNDYGRWWISSAGATTFTVNVSSDPGASNLDFWWEAKVR
jgi:hypothetical protein